MIVFSWLIPHAVLEYDSCLQIIFILFQVSYKILFEELFYQFHMYDKFSDVFFH